MSTVILIAIALFALGHVLKLPMQARWIMIGLLYVAVLIVQLVFPDGHALREATGGSKELWLILGGVVALVLTYRAGLKWLKARAQPVPQADAPKGPFSEAELERYGRHIVLREVGGPGQKALKDAKVLVIGAGGLGSPLLLYLAAAGVGTIGVVDDDEVDASNLQRQIIHTDDRIGMPKVFSAQKAIADLNPYVTVRPYHRRLDQEHAQELFAEYDLVLDGTDNFNTRYMVNRVAVATGTPLLAAAIGQWEGQISLYDPSKGAPCYECIFPEAPDPSLTPSCALAGVVGALPGVMGSMMALEAIKEICNAGEGLRGRMLIYDALYADNRMMRLKPRDDCPVCGGKG